MAIFDGQWWGQWWPWLVVWLVTVAMIVVAVYQVVRAVRSGRTPPHTHGSVFYLDEKYVMNLYQMYGGKYRAALSQEVEERSTKTRETALAAEGGPARVNTKRGSQDEVFRRWVETTEAITIFRIVMDVLERAGDIVHVDLRAGTVVGDHALSAALDMVDGRVPADVQLSDIDAFVNVRGKFRIAETGEKKVTLVAGHLTLPCATKYLQDPDRLSESFPARCLARPQQVTADGHLILHPIAIFR
ncbi:hypothetical protein [Kibdelosporangium phytohabitans]|uniref:Uncharacterized protein n=1 Tax=Kibdelosporangium phytohabitans TaxID=860235 RepID=A0A0N7F3I9_9PSEU|nr:hypothetical protein [Kibdelosporangium phytohabitans]ALG08759.1 hypothetical protein AOZ06_19205 [Kibdelosporangium phytohabitans]MBE1470118.1 hypothetical protein [Kibdelosporangium phytohabitans]